MDRKLSADLSKLGMYEVVESSRESLQSETGYVIVTSFEFENSKKD